MSFEAAVQRWHDFYVIAGTASATLVGLLFVGLSLHLRVVIARADMRALARVTLANYALLLFLSLFVVIPQSRSALSLQLIISGAITLAIGAPNLVAAARRQTRTIRLSQLMLRFGLSTLAHGGVVVAGAVLASGSVEATLNLLVAVTIALLMVSLRNSWDLLVAVGAATA